MEPSYDLLIQQLIEMRVSEHNAIWQQAAISYVLVKRHGIKPGDIASQINCSSVHVRDMVRTFEAFPEVEDRCPELTWQHHKLCAKTDDPVGWLNKAVENGWSSRELSQAISGQVVRDELRAASAAWAKVLRIIDAGGEPAEWLRQQIANYKF